MHQAAAMSTWFTLFSRLNASGVLQTPTPHASRCWNGDEVGFAPTGKFSGTYTLGRRGARGWNVCGSKGEHNDFWTTGFLWTNGDGRRLTPLVIHQGPEDSFPSHKALNLPGHWGVTCTPSGYMDCKSFLYVCVQLVEFAAASASDPHFVFIDGHYSHFDVEALEYLLKNHIYCCFLKSQASHSDQPNDLGANELWKAKYNLCYSEWKIAHPGISFTSYYFNGVMAAAWDLFDKDANTSGVIRRAWAKANLSPFPRTTRSVETGELIFHFPDTVDKNSQSAMAEIFSSDKIQQAGLSELKKPETLREFEVRVCIPDVPLPPHVVLTLSSSRTQQDSEWPLYDAVVRQSAYTFLQTSFVVPAQQLRFELEEVNNCKNINIPKPTDEDRKMPSNAAAMVVTDAIIAKMKIVVYFKKIVHLVNLINYYIKIVPQFINFGGPILLFVLL